jgi:hypothetical protein
MVKIGITVLCTVALCWGVLYFVPAAQHPAFSVGGAHPFGITWLMILGLCVGVFVFKRIK